MHLKGVINKTRIAAILAASVALFVTRPVAADQVIEPELLPAVAPPPTTDPTPVPAEPAPPPAAVPPNGPVVELPADPAPTEVAAPEPPIDDAELVRGLRDHRLDQVGATGSVLGGYGELHYNLELPEGGESAGSLDLHRFVFFAAHKFSEQFRLYAEVEIEHAFSSIEDAAPGEVEVEQAYLDWQPWGKALGLRAGIVIVPMGIINQWHEPPVFHGVERPRVDELVIPTTWREGGIGIFGEPVEGLRYELYLVGGLNAAHFDADENFHGFDAEASIREGRQSVAESVANGPAVAGRIEWEPTLGVVLGGSAYYGLAGPNADDLFRLVGRNVVTGEPIVQKLELAVPVLGLEADVRARLHGFEGRAVFATFSVGDTAALREAVDSVSGDGLGLDVGARALGTYVEVAYDVLRFAPGTEQQLLPFVRFEYYDTMAALAGRARTPADGAFRATDLVFGLSYRPILQVVVKADFILRTPAAGPTNRLVDVGIGWMF